MEEASRLRSSQGSFRAHVTRTYARIADITESTTPVTPAQRITLATSLEILEEKKIVLKELDTKIIGATQEPGQLEEEICETEEYHAVLLEKIAFLRDFMTRTHPPSSDDPATVRLVTSTESVTMQAIPQHVNATENAITSSDVIQPTDTPPLSEGDQEVSVRTNHTSINTSNCVSRLPKLSLPYFSGDPLTWQTFWDSFDAAVNSNASLTGVQKFNYLRAQLQGDAARVVAGFPLTDDNYVHSVTLLKQRFGQPYKLVNAHMQAFVKLPNPVNTLDSRQAFYDSIESHIRALTSLGKSPESYGALLTPIILGKLPNDIRKNLARDHSNMEWTLDDLRSNILREIQILETGIHSSKFNHTDLLPITMASLYTGSRHHPPNPTDRKKSMSCIYCKGPHSPSACDVVTDQQEHTAIVKRDKLCYNCLGHHKIAACNSKFKCRNCKHKHHTSLCTGSGSQSTPPSNTKNNPEGSSQTTGLFTPSVPESGHPSQTSSCLLKTAVAMVSTPNVTMEGNIIFGEGAQRSFITQDLATKLHLQPHGKDNICLA